MKKILVLIITMCLLSSCGATVSTENAKGNTTNNSRKVSLQEIEIIRSYFNFNKEDLLVIAAIQPRNRCHYNQYENLKSSTDWIFNLVNNARVSNAKRVLIILEKQTRDNLIDGKRIFNDPNNFILNTLFSSSDGCYGVVVLNKSGEYLIKNGEFVEKDIVIMANKLKPKNNSRI